MENRVDYKVYRMVNIDATAVVSHNEAFICFDTQEDRAFNALLRLHEKQAIGDVMVLSFPLVGQGADAVAFRVQGLAVVTHEIEEDLNCNMIPCLTAINNYVDGKSVVGVDISCMPIPFLAQLFHFLIENHPDKSIKVYYTEPAHYSLQNLFDYSTYSGEIDFKAVRGFEGETSQTDEVKRVLFYLMGFEMKYIYSRIQQDVAPDEIAPINGFPSYFPKYKDVSLINDGNDFYERDIEILFAEANNPFEVYNTLVSLESKYRDYRIDIIPVCTKPMALGACLYALKNGNNRCRIIFPFPSDYRPKQSRGQGNLWEYSI